METKEQDKFQLDEMQRRLISVLKQLDLNPYRIAKKTGKRERKYQSIMLGQGLPSIETFIEILKAFPEINERYIFREEMPMIADAQELKKREEEKIRELAEYKKQIDQHQKEIEDKLEIIKLQRQLLETKKPHQ